MRTEDYTEDQLCVLALAAMPGIGPSTINRLASNTQEATIPIRRLLEAPPCFDRILSQLPRASQKSIARIRAPLQRATELLELLRKANAHPVFREEPAYPDKLSQFLGESAPPVLFIVGNEQRLRGPSIAIVGSRQPSEESRRAAFEFAARQAETGKLVVSGGARGIDTAGHQGALTRGRTVVVPPTGVMRYRSRKLGDVRPGSEKCCIVGQFPPRDPWRTRNALQRNHTIVALSDCVVGFEPRDHGGTWRSCRSALRMGKPLFVVNAREQGPYERGQQSFVNTGAIALDPRRMPGPEEFSDLVEGYTPPSTDVQLPLFQAD